MGDAIPVTGDCAKVTVQVPVDPAIAFEVFTSEIDLWWRSGTRFRRSAQGQGVGALLFEPGEGGRLFETFSGPGGPRTFTVGTITAWEPPARLAFEWRNANFAGHEKTEVEVTFKKVDSGSEVALEHRGWAALRSDHPEAMSRMIALWWGELLGAFHERLASMAVC